FYWCAALQRGAPSVARSGGGAALVFSWLLLGAPLLLVQLPYNVVEPGKDGFTLAEIVGVWTVWGIMSVLLFAAPAWLGGMAPDFARRRRFRAVAAVAATGAVLAATLAVLFILYHLGMLFALGGRRTWTVASASLQPLPAVAGWSVGLVVSGFPAV